MPYKCFLMHMYQTVHLKHRRCLMFLTPCIQCVYVFHEDKFPFQVILWSFILSNVQICIFAQVSSSDRRLCLWLNISHPVMFHGSVLCPYHRTYVLYFELFQIYLTRFWIPQSWSFIVVMLMQNVQNSGRPCLTYYNFDPVDQNVKITIEFHSSG